MGPRVYLAGPMSGYPEKNYPAFHAAAAALRAEGYEVISPAENQIPDTNLGEWQNAMCFDVGECVCKVMGVAVLPGFEKSKGACLEVHTALALGKPVFLVPGQPESWRTRVLEWGRLSMAAMWREVDHTKYDATHQDLAKVVRGDRLNNPAFLDNLHE